MAEVGNDVNPLATAWSFACVGEFVGMAVLAGALNLLAGLGDSLGMYECEAQLEPVMDLLMIVMAVLS